MHSRSPERRRSPRIKKGLPLKISCGDFDIVSETKNISGIGVYCTVDRYLELMTKLDILLLLPFPREGKTITKKIGCKGVVVRTEAPGDKNGRYHTAIYFNEISRKDKKTLNDFLALFTSPPI